MLSLVPTAPRPGYYRQVIEEFGIPDSDPRADVALDIVMQATVSDTYEDATAFAHRLYGPWGVGIVDSIWPQIEESHQLCLGA